MPRRSSEPSPEDPIRVEIGRAIKALRHYHGWTQVELEWRCGLDQTVISRVERGRDVSLRLSSLIRVLGALGVDRVIFKSGREGRTALAFAMRLADPDDPHALGPAWPRRREDGTLERVPDHGRLDGDPIR
jgi:transcriptional regulator with XRE-family HTH domain